MTTVFEIHKGYNFKTIIPFAGITQHDAKVVDSILPYKLMVKMEGQSPEELHSGIAASLPDDLKDIDLTEQTYLSFKDDTIIPTYIIDAASVSLLEPMDINLSLRGITPDKLNTIIAYLRANKVDFKVG